MDTTIERPPCRCPTHLVDFSKRTIAQLANNFPDVIRIDIPVDVLVLLDFLFYFNCGQPQYFAESSERHYLQCVKIFKKSVWEGGGEKALHSEYYARRDVKTRHKHLSTKFTNPRFALLREREKKKKENNI